MSKQSWRGSTLLNPEPPVLVSCGGLEKPNLITIGWTGTICTQPSMVSISVRPERYSHHLIQESGQFAINLPTEALVRSVDWCGVKSGRDVDKFAACGLHAAPGTVLTGCPILEESPVNLECRVTQVIPLGSHDLFLAEVAACDVDESLLDESGSRRDTDTFFKRFTAEGFYHVMNALGAEIVFNHADYRLISTRVLESFADYKEVNIFLRGMVPLVGFKSEVVTYERHERLAGESHYPLSKMLALAFDGITSLSNKPIRIITGAGLVVSLVGFVGVIWAIIQAALGSSVAGWASIVCIVCFMGGVQLVCLGVIGEYIGKIYMETKARPRYIISERTWAPYERKYHG